MSVEVIQGRGRVIKACVRGVSVEDASADRFTQSFGAPVRLQLPGGDACTVHSPPRSDNWDSPCCDGHSRLKQLKDTQQEEQQGTDEACQ